MIIISAKSIRNLIITLIIIAFGIKLIMYILSNYINIYAAGELGQSFTDMGTLFMYGCLAIAIVLIPFYLSARSNENKTR